MITTPAPQRDEIKSTGDKRKFAHKRYVFVQFAMNVINLELCKVGTIFKQSRFSHVAGAIENNTDCDDTDDEVDQHQFIQQDALQYTGAVNQDDQFSDSAASGNEEQDGDFLARFSSTIALTLLD